MFSFRFRQSRNFILLLSVFLGPAKFIAAQPGAGIPSPKNIIFMIGDGMGYNAIRATASYLGEQKLVFEEFPVRLFMAHYPAKAGEYDPQKAGSNNFATGYNTVAAWTDPAYLKRNVTESAAAATAMATGFKTYNNAIGMSVDFDTLVNLVQWAKAIGKSAGVVTTVPISHATPAGFVAHNTLRTRYSELAYEMLLDSRCDLIMGCGNPGFDDDGHARRQGWKNAKYVGDSSFWSAIVSGSGKEIHFRAGGKSNTVKDCDGDGSPDPWTVIQSLSDFHSLMDGPTPKRVLGCPEVYSTLQQGRVMQHGETVNSAPYITPFISSVPILAEMVAGALNVLDNNPKGFFIMVEGGAIDWAAHSNQKGRLIEEMNDFSEAVKRVIEWVERYSSWNETMLIVTGDHETGMIWGGEPFQPIKARGKGNLPEMQFNAKGHSNSLIPFFSKGAGSELYHGFADERDSVWGPYIQNSEVPQLIHFLWSK